MNTRISLVATGLATTLAVMAGPVRSAFGQDVTLRYRWTKGEEVRHRFVQQSTATVSGLPGGVGEMTVETSTSQVLRTMVDDVAADGTATLRYVYESARWEMKSPMGAMTYDTAANDPATANPMTGMMKEMLSAMIGESFVIVMSPNGQVQKVEGMSRLMEKMFKSLPPDPSMAAMLEGLKSNLSDDGMRSAFAQSYSQFPDQPLKPGDTWDNQSTTTNPMIGRLTTTTVSTLKAVEANAEDRVARIATNLTIKPDQNTLATNPMGLKMQLGDSSGEGELIVDVVKGRLRRSTTRTTMPMTMSRPGPDGNAMNMQTLAKSIITVELVP